MEKTFRSLLILSISLLLFTNYSICQQKKAKMSFTSLRHDFGKINEDGGLAIFKFDFSNTGGEPIIITTAEATCGCTTPEWSKQPVPPGAKGYLTAAFDPRNRPGPFTKSIKVSSNAENSPVELIITGDVAPKAHTVDDIFPFKMDELRLKSNNIAFTNLFNDEIKSDELEIINTSASPLSISFDIKSLPPHLKLEAIPPTLNPKAQGKIKVTYDAKKKNDWDFVTDLVPVLLNNKNVITNRLTISATIKERFTKNQISNPPAIYVENNTYNFGKVKEGQKIVYEYKFKNRGKSDLILRKLKTTCTCISANVVEKTIGPGKSGTIKVEFNTAGQLGKHTKLITIITNIPSEENLRVILKLLGEVEK